MGERVLVSSCLLGVRCRYDGTSNAAVRAQALDAEGLAVPVCPEMLGGLPSPRLRAEIVGGDGGDVLDGRASVRTQDGRDVTAEFLAGAQATLEEAVRAGATRAILKTRSPSCGCGEIADGSFAGTRRAGDGVTTALLARNGIQVEALG